MSSSSTKTCFNAECKDFKSERSRKGWRLRNGEFSELCDRCASAFEEGRFCETFHSHDSGWRGCESCGKWVHCGCIVSVHTFILLDAGGIQCMMCSRKNSILTPNPGWSASLSLPSSVADLLKDPATRSWSKFVGTGSTRLWWHATNLYNSSTSNSDLQSRMPFVVDVTNGVDGIMGGDKLASSSLERHKICTNAERLLNGSVEQPVYEMPECGKTAFSQEEKPSSCLSSSLHTSIFKDKPSTPHFVLASHSTLASETVSQTTVCGIQSQQLMPPLALGKALTGGSHNGVDSSGETQMPNSRLRADARDRNQLLPRYWPRISNQELQQISGDSNSIITPLFEKMLSASDAGRIGRLVLPKKCAETYFPPISQPEGLPLKVQDVKGKEWIFQFRFWPNNNSRMYVLEGITPCIQSMQLQAGDVVTFSRLEPEGKLVMGFRKASTVPSPDQAMQPIKTGNGMSTTGDANASDPASVWSKIDTSGYIAKETLGASLPSKRKNGMLGSRNKRLRLDNSDIIELKVTLEEVQGLFRSPGDHVSNVVIIEEFEIEEYEDAPVIGRPTIIASEHVQWAQCEDCLKWRKLPSDALLPPRWTCSKNSWDPERFSCDAAQELTAEQVEDLLSTRNPSASKKLKAAKQDPSPLETLEGLDALANLAIREEGDSVPSSSQTTTKHPRHRPGCSCIVCIQPPSGKGPKHKQTCTCNVCLTVKRRFQTMMLRRERKLSEEAETAHQKGNQNPQSLGNLERAVDLSDCNSVGCSSPDQKATCTQGSDEDPSQRSSISPYRGQFDLNIQPERDEELSPVSDSAGMLRLLQDATERYLQQQRQLHSDSSINTNGSQRESSPAQLGGDDQHPSQTPIIGQSGGATLSPLAMLSVSPVASTSATG
ncbi:hypothetical protein Nepgr_007234 [Nepenthes gracilis]|uniref:B3 domain-containing protein Os07g0563300-like n=1 Tax=Nepenthes gracilis TaxID=150966 RepID=A0AAD3S6T2_NEPGR|nr:hypothetical protein Nepgr_007234 [Nepenthes gracilis]